MLEILAKANRVGLSRFDIVQAYGNAKSVLTSQLLMPHGFRFIGKLSAQIQTTYSKQDLEL